MPNIIDLEGLPEAVVPEAVVKAITETVDSLKRHYRMQPSQSRLPLLNLPSRPGKVIGPLRRVDVYDERS